jgi:hypothetical protein
LKALLAGFHGFGIIWGSKAAGAQERQETVQAQSTQVGTFALGQ